MNNFPKNQAPMTEPVSVADGRIIISPNTPEVEVDGQTKIFTPVRTRILGQLALSVDTYIPKWKITEEAGLKADADSNTLHVHVSQIRKQLGEELGNTKSGAIKTRPGVGICAVSTLLEPVYPIIDPQGATYEVADGRIAVDGQRYTVSADGKIIEDITFAESQLALFLARSANIVFNPAKLQSILNDGNNSRSVSMHMSNLRAKLGHELGDTKTGAFRTKVGVGYKAVRTL